MGLEEGGGGPGTQVLEAGSQWAWKLLMAESSWLETEEPWGWVAAAEPDAWVAVH